MGYYGKLWESTEIKGILGSLYGYPQAKNNATPPILTPLATPGSLSKTNCTRPEKGELKGADLWVRHHPWAEFTPQAKSQLTLCGQAGKKQKQGNAHEQRKHAAIMTQEAASTFTVTSWEEKPYEGSSDDLKITQALVTKNYTGDISGVGSVIYIMKHTANGTAEFIGLQQINGAIGSKAGSFAIEQNGFFDGKEAKGTFKIKPGSGTGALANLEGEGQFSAPIGKLGTLKLVYSLAV